MSGEQTNAAVTRPGTASSHSTARTQVSTGKQPVPTEQNGGQSPIHAKSEYHGGEGESAIPEDRKVSCSRLRRSLAYLGIAGGLERGLRG
jgi:hypothetical protein